MLGNRAAAQSNLFSLFFVNVYILRLLLLLSLMPMKIVIGARRSGKTTQCYRTLEQNPNVVMLVLSNDFIYCAPKHLRSRIMSYQSKMLRGCNCKFIIDEADFMDEEYLQNILSNQILAVYTSLGKSYNTPNTWLRRQIMVYGYNKLCTLIPLELYQRFSDELTQDEFNREFLCFFKDLYRTARL
jgi:hypothetical protein